MRTNPIIIKENVSDRVLTVGSQYLNNRGGIGGVIATYSNYFEKFNYLCTYGISESKIQIVLNFAKAVVSLFIKLLLNRNIRIVHIHGAAKGSVFRKVIIFVVSKYVYSKKVIFHCHGSEMEMFYNSAPNLQKKVIRFFFENVDIIICLSNSWKAFFENNFSPKKIYVLENIVEKLAITNQNVVKGKQVKFVFMGAIGNRKGVFDLLNVINDHKEQLLGKMLLYIGGNGEVSKLKDFLVTNNLSDIIEYKGWISGLAKDELYRNSNVYILPSYNEGLPLSILEAMTFGLPVISTKVGGIPEIVKDGVNGFTFIPGNKGDILTYILKLLDNPDLCNQYGKESLKIVEPYYATNVIPKLQRIYESLI